MENPIYVKDAVRDSKAEYPKLKMSRVEKGRCFNAFVDFVIFRYGGNKARLEKIPFVIESI